MKQLIASILFVLTTSTFAQGLPFIIETHSLEIESLKGTVTYGTKNGSCAKVHKSIQGKKINDTKFSMDLKRSEFSYCGFLVLLEGDFELKTKGNSPVVFKVKRGKLLNNYAPRWGTVIWGAWVDGECNFRDGEFKSCDAGSDATWTGKEPFTLYIHPTYPAFKWNIQEVLR